MQLIPKIRNYVTFMGLVAPPCTENVLWLVLKTSMPASWEQLPSFGTIYKNNVRSVNGRLIKELRQP